jgi:hypothetical protein
MATICINGGGGLSGFSPIYVQEDTAEVLLEALAEVLGAKVDFDWAEKEPDSQIGTIYVERLAG